MAPASCTLLAVPNLSEGRDATTVDAIAAAAADPVQVLDRHSDPDHNRSVLTLAGPPAALAPAVLRMAHAAIARIDLTTHQGVHPRVGALDVAPVVFLDAPDLGAACAEALLLADGLGELGLPVLLYGLLGGGRSRAELRRGGLPALTLRLRARELEPDFGPRQPHPTAGCVLVAARPPLAAFNLELAAGATLAQARQVAARVREGGPDGLPGVRAIGLGLAHQGLVQVSTNVEDPVGVPLARVLEAVAAHAPISGAELLGLVPEATLTGWPSDIPLRGAQTIEAALAS